MVERRAQSDLTLDDLLKQADRLLHDCGLASRSGDGRVSPVPDARTVRYYATLGLIDRPDIQGRDARYRRRHVHQLVAIKALQAAGLRLADIQRRLHGRSDDELGALVDAAAARPKAAAGPTPLVWREITLEPGLRLVADERWKPEADPDALVRRFRAAIAALGSPSRSRHRAGDDA
jgi:DNA-binding transcriptional MerR regulator